MRKKIITLTDDEVVDLLRALEGNIQSYKEIRAGYVGDPEYADRLKWFDNSIQRMRELHRRILKTPPSD